MDNFTYICGNKNVIIMEAIIDTKPYLSQFNGLDVSVLECIYKDLGEMISRLKSPKKAKKPVREKTIEELIAQKEELTEEEKLRLFDDWCGSWKDMPEDLFQEILDSVHGNSELDEERDRQLLEEMGVL